MKRISCILLSLVMIMTMLFGIDFSAAASKSLSVGDNATAIFDATEKTLTVTGSGDVIDYTALNAPFKDNTVYNFESVIIGEGITSIGDYFLANNLYVKSVEIPSTVTRIGERAFSGCKNIVSINVPKSVEIIGANAFCTGVETMKGALTEIVVDPDNNNYTSIDGILYDKQLTTLIKVPSSYPGNQLRVPSTVTSILEYAAVKCLNLQSVSIPRDVTTIGNYAFAACKNLSSVTIENPNKNMTLSSNAFKTRTYNSSLGTYEELLINSDLMFFAYDNSFVKQYATDIGAGFTPLTCQHNYSLYSTVPSTCTENGQNIYVCLICNDSYSDSLPLKQHDFLTTKTVKANCTEKGYTVYNCSDCDEEKTVYTEPLGHKENTITTKATASADGKIVKTCTVCLKTLSTTVIPRVSSIKLEATSLTYNGKVRTPRVYIKDRTGKTLVKNTDYTVTYASGRKYVGKYAVKITFKGKYSGTKTLYFTIKPKATSISSVSAGSKKFTVKWKKQATQTTGYQIQYSASSKFTSPKYVTVGKNTTLSKTISKLKGGKKYYVRVRTYKTVGSTKYFSSWSTAKAITTKR